MTGCQTCGGYGNRHDPIAHGAEERAANEPCVTDWLCLPGAHLRFGECVEEWFGDYPRRECDHDNGECHDVEHQR